MNKNGNNNKGMFKKKGYKNFMSKLYGIGASVVIIGALFKINHYDYANELLIIGLATEAIIFFFSAFEPPYVDPDWSRIYPELKVDYHGIEADASELGKSGFRSGSSPTSELDNMLSNAKIGPELIESLGKGLNNLKESAHKLSHLSESTIATDEFSKNIKTASVNVSDLSEKYKKSSEQFTEEQKAHQALLQSIKNTSTSANVLSESYSSVAENLKKNSGGTIEFTQKLKGATDEAAQLITKYRESADVLSKAISNLNGNEDRSGKIGDQLKKLNENLASINSVYELYLKNLNSVNSSESMMKSSIDSFVSNLKQSSEHTIAYQKEVDNLTKRISALNSVYGNMLSAMNIKM